MSQKLGKALVSSSLKPLNLLLGPFVQIHAFYFSYPGILSKGSSTVEAEKDSVSDLGPLFTWFPTVYTKIVSLNLQKFLQSLTHLYFLFLHRFNVNIAILSQCKALNQIYTQKECRSSLLQKAQPKHQIRTFYSIFDLILARTYILQSQQPSQLIHMQKLIPIISDLNEIVRKSEVNFEMNLPIIAVVGSQSTGKSSLLQSIIGREFLPKGKGIVTRRPIEIQLSQINNDKEYGEIVDKKGDFYQNMEQFKKVIDLQTQKACGNNKGISSVPLRLRYYSKKVLNLLLVDLPGIVKNPTGDQPKDIEQQVTKMIKAYISNKNCLIIAVSKATQDSANSESLKLARQIDREGIRTIGVLTQVDLVEENISILKDYNTLSNKLLLGHTCVYLRPGKSALSLDEQMLKEKEFFTKHQQYSHIADKMGVKSLVRTMNMVLIKHIKAQLPSIRQRVVYLIESKKEKLSEYGHFQPIKDKKAQGILILALISKYVRYFVQMIEGKYSQSREAVIGGARIQFIFSQIFIKSINRMNPFEFLTDTDIRTAIRNANGLRKSLFLPEAAFETLLKTQIIRLKMPALECSHLIHEQLRRMIYSIKIQQIERYEYLSKQISEVMQDLLFKSLSKTQQMIKSLIQIELGYINTNHPDFIDVISLVKSDNKGKKEQYNSIDFQPESQKEHFEEQAHKIESSFRFNKKRDNKNAAEQSQFLEAKLNQMQTHKLKKEDKSDREIVKNQYQPDIESFYSSYSDYRQLPRYMLPSVPSIIKVNQNPKLRQQTETQMIKRLIVSYFNVVKKNVNDSVPKTIVTFLVNHCRNSCEKILVNNLYVEDQFQNLLLQQDYVTKERQRLSEDITILRACLNEINSLDSQLAL